MADACRPSQQDDDEQVISIIKTGSNGGIFEKLASMQFKSLRSVGLVAQTLSSFGRVNSPGGAGASPHPSERVSMERSLPSQVDVDMLRAVPRTEVLSGFGKHWQTSGATASDYDLSEPVAELDDFISHSWAGTTPQKKFWTLCLLSNRGAACIISCLLAILLALLGTTTMVPKVLHGEAAKIVCPVVYFVVLLFWQRLSAPCRRRKSYVFLDKLCIHQTDEEQKAQGILGLAGFLRASQRLVVLWSPHYFSRLWCTYELVAWCYLHGGDSSRVRFLPVAASGVQGRLTLSFTVLELLKLLLWRTYSREDAAWRSFLAEAHYLLLPMVVGILILPLVYSWIGLARELNQLQEQVENFEIRKAECFCCKHDHRHPDTGQTLGCDRKLVYATLRKWYDRMSEMETTNTAGSLGNVQTLKTVGSTVDEALDNFDEVVRHKLSDVLSRSTNKALLCLSYRDCALALVPVAWSAFDYVFLACREGHYFRATRWVLGYAIIPLFVFPLASAATCKTANVIEKLCDAFQLSSCRTVMASCFATAVFFFTFGALWGAGDFMISDVETFVVNDLYMLLYYLGLAVLTAYAILPSNACAEDLETDGLRGSLQFGEELRQSSLVTPQLSNCSDVATDLELQREMSQAAYPLDLGAAQMFGLQGRRSDESVSCTISI
eukprot:TRINITY_DN5992_c0_g1_i1.p1 TRINITY_DN5992_c0_g1~~TRINITY_DN5992_c0_g1_i1.p1  ORF type:complete len:692 (-),score=59.13 TRINITY_DN5992_c0_g1_i1:272-2266(-)